jgi:hypothetical protein
MAVDDEPRFSIPHYLSTGGRGSNVRSGRPGARKGRPALRRPSLKELMEMLMTIELLPLKEPHRSWLEAVVVSVVLGGANGSIVAPGPGFTSFPLTEDGCDALRRCVSGPFKP